MKKRNGTLVALACGGLAALALAVFLSKDKEMEVPMEITLTKENFETEVLKSDRPVLVDFWATWCGPCQMLSPVLAEVAAEKAGRIRVGKVNVDEQPELAAKYGVTGIPALLVFINGNLVAASTGFLPKPDLDAFVDRHARP